MTVIQPLYTREPQLIKLHPCPEGCSTEDYLTALGEVVILEDEHNTKIYGWKDALQSLSSVMMNVMSVMDEDIMADVKHVMKQAARESLPVLLRILSEEDEQLLNDDSIKTLLDYLNPSFISLWTPGRWLHTETRLKLIQPYTQLEIKNYYEQDRDNYKFVSELTDEYYILTVGS